jgi:phosphoglycerate kinase
MFNKKTVKDIEVGGKRVLVRVDFNVPIKDGQVADDTRIRASLPTIQYLLEHNAAVILCSHLGRPKGGPDPAFSLRPAADRLSELIARPVSFVPVPVGPAAVQAAKNLQSGEVLVLENTRFNPGETKNDPEMAKQLADLADIFVLDAFGSAHRAHASTEGVTHYLPSVAGFLLEKEIRYLGQAIANPEHPFVAILGGAKVSDKIGVIRNLLARADKVLIGGGMANTFLKAMGNPVGDSLVEDEVLDTARDLLAEGAKRLVLPADLVIANAFDAEADWDIIPVGPVPDGWRIMDIGPETVSGFAKAVAEAKTVVWNGPMGVFEFPRFAQGTFGLAKAVAESQATSIVGGGDSVAALQEAGLADQITHLSTGGGASLEMLEGKELPGVAALQDK